MQGTNPVSFAFPSAQGFTTGSNSGGYTLKSVTLTLKDSRANNTDNFTLSLYSATSNGKPNASLATLAPPTGDISGRNVADYTFTCSTGCQLAGDNTTYFIVLQPASGKEYYWYQDTSPNQTNTPADGGWTIADVAQYRNSGTWTDESPVLVKQMSVSYVGPDLWVENISQTEVDLKLRNWAGTSWSYKLDFSNGSGRTRCKEVTRVTLVSDGSLVAGSEFTVSAFKGSTCSQANLLDTETFTTPAAGAKRPTLSVSNVANTSATLDLANHSGDWWYQRTFGSSAGTCTKVDSGTYSVSLGSLTANTAYYYNAYSHAGCEDASVPITWISSVGFNTTGSISVTLTDHTDSQVTLTVSGIDTSHWSYTYRNENTGAFGACRTFDATTTSVIASGLESGTPFTFRVYRGSSCTLDERVTVNTHTISLSSGQVGSNSATLKMENYNGAWYHQQAGGSGGAQAGGCSTAVNGPTTTLTGLTASTEYTWKAYKAEGCADADAIASTSFTTRAAGTSPPTGGEPDPQPEFGSATVVNLAYQQGRPIDSLTLPEADGGEGVLTYSLAPALPAGLSFDAATRILSGTPTEAQPATTYTYTATNANGDRTTLTFALTVEADLQPTFGVHTMGDQAYEQHRAIEILTLPLASGGNGPFTYALTPDPPAGLMFDAATRTLSGTPTAAHPATPYTYTATDADATDPDSTTLTFTIEVKAADTAPTFGDQQLPALRLPRGQVIEPQELPAATGGNGEVTYALSPGLPAGLTFNPATRVLSGLPTAATGPQSYEYTATDADVSEPDVARLTFTIEVVLSAAEQAILEDGLAAQGRALLSGATGVIGERFRNPGASSGAEAGVAACLGETGPRAAGTEDAEPEPECATGLLTTVAQAMLGMSGAGSSADPWGMADADDSRLRGPGLGNGGAQPAWDWESLIWGRSFALPLNAQGTPGSAWTLWGAGDIQGFEGAPRQGRYDGQVRSLYLGVDMQWQAHWLAGAALAQSWGKTDYVAEPGGRAGQLETTLTSIYPYVRGTLGSGLEVWAIGGYGRGEAEQTQPGAAGDTRDLTLAMGATGVRQPMTEVGGAQLALVGGAGYLSLATEEGNSTIADLDVAVNRARLAVEATWTAGGLAPYVQVGGRYDGGAGQTGAGLETVAGLRYTSERLEFEARGRWLAAHAAEGYAEYGGLARLAVKPQADGTGFRMAVAPRWGAADGGAGVLGGGAALLDGGAMPGLGVNGLPSATTRALMLESELGYGVAVFEGHGILTPYGGFAFTGNETRQYRLGARLGMAQWLNLSLEGARRDSTGPQPADQGVQLQLQGRF